VNLRQARNRPPAARRRRRPAIRKETLEVLSLIVSTVAYFIASHYIKRYLDDIEAPTGFTRSALTFCAALLIAYGVAFAVDWAESLAEKHAGQRTPVGAIVPAPAATAYFFTYFWTRQLSVSAT
jgi:hypothetical protein